MYKKEFLVVDLHLDDDDFDSIPKQKRQELIKKYERPLKYVRRLGSSPDRINELIDNGYDISVSIEFNNGNKYIVIKKHRDFKLQDRPLWIPFELSENLVNDLIHEIKSHLN